jgi:hypothetical protein
MRSVIILKSNLERLVIVSRLDRSVLFHGQDKTIQTSMFRLFFTCVLNMGLIGKNHRIKPL